MKADERRILMRIIFIGTSKLSVSTAKNFLKTRHEVVFIEMDKNRIEDLSDEMDCGFLEGDGSTPAVLEKVGPEQTDFLFCLTGNDKDNIIAGLVGRSLSFPRVIIKVEDPALEHICAELGLEDVIVPTRTISRYLSEMVSGKDVSELSTAIKDNARFFSFIAGEDDEKEIGEFDLPKKARIICFYRNGDFNLAAQDSLVKKGDEVIVLTHRDTVEALKEKWPAQTSGDKVGEDELKS
jgi:trk system potassium uptake protein TrkA